LLHQCIALTSTQANERQIEIIDHVSGHDYIVHADFTRLKQVLINLLSNAIKYNCKHGSITLEAEIINDKYLHINITDTGDGILEKDIAKLFTPFERLNKKHNVEGTGIGLVISKYLIELMGGNIGVNSTPNEGTCFWIELTLARSTFNSEQETNLNE
ncbi:MAG: hypothetical protein KAT90_11950, partial [Gammaproteobacteria bacterium]|nr:hypothetical protein [Gammaproteobacteria bacterium]